MPTIDEMTAVERKAFRRCIDNTLLSMDEYRGILMKLRGMDNPLDINEEEVVPKHNAFGENSDKVMDVLGYGDEDEDDEDEDEEDEG